jgi:hypothetical protein
VFKWKVESYEDIYAVTSPDGRYTFVCSGASMLAFGLFFVRRAFGFARRGGGGCLEFEIEVPDYVGYVSGDRLEMVD